MRVLWAAALLVAVLGGLAPPATAAPGSPPPRGVGPCLLVPPAKGSKPTSDGCYDLRTTWDAGGGALSTRTIQATIGKRTPVDVDDDASTDLFVTLNITATTAYLLDVERADDETATLPLSVEAIVGTTQQFTFGYDALEGRAPESAQIGAQVDTSGQTFDIAQQGSISPLALLASLTTTTDGACTTDETLRVAYPTAPPSATVNVTNARGLHATLTQPAAAPVTVARRVGCAAPELFTADVADAPTQLSLHVDPDAETITYSGAAAADSMTVTAATPGGGFFSTDHMRTTLQDVPATVALSVGATPQGVTVDASVPVGDVHLQAWSEGRSAPVVTGRGVALDTSTASGFTLAARASDLELLDVDVADGVEIATRTGPSLFNVDVTTDSVALQTSIDALPSVFSAGVDLDGGEVSLAASGAINRVRLVVESAEPMLGGATEYEMDLQSVPTAVDLSWTSDGDTVSVDVTNAIGQLDLRGRSANRTFPLIPAGEAGVILDSRDGELALAVRAFQAQSLDLDFVPFALDSRMQGGRKFIVDGIVEMQDATGLGTAIAEVDAIVDQLPSRFTGGLEDVPGATTDDPSGVRLALNANASIGFLRLSSEGHELLPGADRLAAELNDLPARFTLEARADGSPLTIDARSQANIETATGQVRFVVSNGSQVLPSFVSDPSFNASPSNTAFRDLVRITNGADTTAVAARLTGIKTASFDVDPLTVSLEQNGARTRPIALDASSDDGGVRAVNVVMNKPSASTLVDIDADAGQPIHLTFENAAPMSSFSVNATSLGSLQTANLTLANIPTKLSGCIADDSQCRRTDRLPSALPNYNAFLSNPAQVATAGGQNRPYPASVSITLDDHGTSGTSSAISSMVTLNGTLRRDQAPAMEFTNVRFHALSLDIGTHQTNPTFPHLGGTVPRVYAFVDSVNKPFVVEEIAYPGTIVEFGAGTTSQPATANTRLAWTPGTRCVVGTPAFCLLQGLDSRTTGSFHCGGQLALRVRAAGLTFNLYDQSGLVLLPLCS